MRLRLVIFVFSMFISHPAFSTDNDQWNYLELSRIVVELDNFEDAKGFGLDSKLTLNEIVYLSGTYQRYSTSISDIDRYLLGVGGKYEINKSLLPFAQLDYVYIDSKSNTFSSSIKYWILGLGISGNYNKFGYKLGMSHYEAISDSLIKNYSGFFAKIYYSINKKLSAGLEVESINDSGDLYNYAVRYHF